MGTYVSMLEMYGRSACCSMIKYYNSDAGFYWYWKISITVATGGIDPWQELSVIQDRTEEGEEDQTVFIRDTAHCADMSSRRITDHYSLKKAKQVCTLWWNVIMYCMTKDVDHKVQKVWPKILTTRSNFCIVTYSNNINTVVAFIFLFATWNTIQLYTFGDL